MSASVGVLVFSTFGCSDSSNSNAGPSHDEVKRSGRIPLTSLRGRIVFSAETYDDIWIADISGANARRITTAAGPEEDPSWGSDGSRVAYRDSRRGYNANDEIYVVNSDGSGRRNLTKSSRNEWGPAWSPNGKLIAFNAEGLLYVMRPDGSGVRQITDIEGEYPTWSPDGQRLAFMSAQPHATGGDPNYDIFTIRVNGKDPRQLTTWSHEDGWPDWSPDGRWIAYTSTRDNHGQYHAPGPYTTIYVMRPDGSGKRRVVSGIYATFPSWSPDSRTIMFSGSALSRPKKHLWVIRLDGSGLRRLPIRGGLADWISR
jgi:Tol biopolymer transport system component